MAYIPAKSRADELGLKICEALGFNQDEFPCRKLELVFEVGQPVLAKVELFPSYESMDKLDVEEIAQVARVEVTKTCSRP